MVYPSHTITLETPAEEKPESAPQSEEKPDAPVRQPEQKSESGAAAVPEKEKKTPAISKKTGIILAVAVVALIIFLLTVHVWKDPTCTNGYKCMFCGKTRGEALGHSWMNATCDAPKTCSTCGEQEGEILEHIWEDATCLKPMTCTLCGKQEGSTIDHDWQEATYTAPKTCSICSETEGDVKGYVGTVKGQKNGTYTRSTKKTSVYQLERKLENCRSFTISYTLTEVTRGNVYGNFEVFIRTGENIWDWKSLGMIEITEDNHTGTVTFVSEEGISFDAVAIFCQAPGRYSYSARTDVTDVQLFE